MRILYIGDIMGEPGIETVESILPAFINEKQIDLVVAQSENVSDGRSMLPEDMERLQAAGVDFFTGGNHTPRRHEIHKFLVKDESPVIGPANMHSCPGKGWKTIFKNGKTYLVVSLLGETFSTTRPPIDKDNPVKSIDEILSQNQDAGIDAVIVSFHGDFSSEKKVMGYYLDGRVSLVVGDHWHVATNDAMVLPKGTAYITDVGMCGSLHSSLGVKYENILLRWRDGLQTRNDLETEGPRQFNALLVETEESGRAKSVEQIKKILN